ncbi:cupin domain-containing protein [Pedobacter metabolipauper]|uniref:Mannose-6-phosphate isomerase-like protein (Cupin superfamily) n=1 Tax=Pedobacter metabolipauper TaxID=425513 RepID=A0A4R6T1H2_9SPHI|nr:cupin domain-containing protein [Pedobacter metabolipauper]TDQ11919.1 mannose-6-phosphate isomerase-like protein (cupin superfamily) [Pedobacter metabolipauper]
MENWDDFVSSEMLNLYISGELSRDEAITIEQIAAVHEGLREEIRSIIHALFEYSKSKGKSLYPRVQHSIRTITDFLDAVEEKYNEEWEKEPSRKGGLATILKMLNPVPEINENSRSEDFAIWANNADLAPDKPYKNIFIREIDKNARMTSYLIWVKNNTFPEVHDNEREKFFILEGTCTVDINDGEETYDLVPGQYFNVPLHKKHTVIVTSAIPCKAILQHIER